jgi:pimeloyl-ACP methyl ester carboxylesterase
VSYVEGWFYGAQFDALTKGDIEAWLSGNVFGAAASDHRQRRQLQWMVDRLEERADHVFPDGASTHEYMCAQQASAPAKHHPLLVYAIVDAAKNAQFLALKKRGFKRYSTGSSTYWRREADEPVDGATPLIFAHGIGIGFLPYHNLINDLVDGCDKDGAPMYLLELPALALTRFSRELPSPKELGEAASSMLAEHNDGAACWVGHSFGTVAITYALKYAPSTVASCALIEPVCFHLHLPDVSRGFLFKETQDPILDILRTDPAISFSLRKRFWWQEAVLWVEDLKGRRCDVFLSSKDDIVPSASVVDYLKDTEVGVHDLGERGHGTWQYDGDVAADVISKALALRRQTTEKRLSIKWPGDDVSIGDALRGVVGDPEPFVDVMSRALYGDVYGAV